MSSRAPTGTVTFFFSDIEGSTRLLEALGPEYADVLERHRQIVRDAFRRCDAVEVGTEGDSFLAVFPSATDALGAAVAIQRALAAEEWPQASTLQTRVGLHTGEATVVDAEYVGLDLHRAARIMAAAHGGQIVISDAMRALVERSLGDGIELRDLGEHRLRDLTGRERLFQVVADGLRSEFPPLRTLEATPNNLPTQTSELVGRDAELAAIRAHLDSPSIRLLTLTGPGGIGKTRLSLHSAAEQVDRFRDGVFFVDLSAARSVDAALQAIVRVLGVTVSGNEELRAALTEQLRDRRLLLLLDNFEQVMDAAVDVAYLLQHSTQLKVLVTSREALRVRGEQLLPVAPLSVPDAGHSSATWDEISRYEAVRLFAARAREAQPTFAPTDGDAVVVAEICAALDGLPLALELAAARLTLFSLQELRDRLRSRLELLRGGGRDVPERHRTLRGTIEWSYDLLDDGERAVLQLLSVFPSARVEAVEAVAAGVDSLARVDVVERLASLVDKSLIRAAEDARGKRLSMLATIREYAAEQLEAEPELRLAARRSHAGYFAAFAQGRQDELGGAGRERGLADLVQELGNLQAAWRFAADSGDVTQLHGLLDALWALHDARGWYHGAVALANDLLEVLARAQPSPGRADDEVTLRLSLARGMLALRGYTEEVEQLYRDALALSGSEDALPRRLPVLRSLASFYLYRGELEKTVAIGREVLELGVREQDTGMQVEGHVMQGPALAFLGQDRAGLEHLDRAIALFDPERHGRFRFRLGPSPGVAATAVSALLHWQFGYPETAALRAADALDLARRLDHPYSSAYAALHVGLLDLWRRRLDLAHDRAGDVLKIAEEHHYPIWRALALVLQGVTVAGLSHPEDGLAQTRRGVALYENLRTPPVFWPQVLGLEATATALAGRTADAVALVDQAAGLTFEGSWDSAMLKVQKADLLLALDDPDRAETCLVRAFDEAGGAGARMMQLWAATRLAGLAAKSGSGEAAARLREVLATFTEGLETPDLLEARSALTRVEAAASGSRSRQAE